MKKLLRLTRLFVCLCAALSSTSAFAGAQWLGNSYINVNTIWYQALGTEAWASGGAFNGANLGVISSLAIGGQLQIGDNGNNWGSGAGDWMHYAIYSGETSVMTGDINLAYESYGYGEYNNNMRFQSGGSNFTATGVDISSLSHGSKYTLKVWFGPIDEKYEVDQSSATYYTATFTKGTDISGADVSGVENTDWTGEVIHPVPEVTVGGTPLTSSDYDVTYSEGCTNVGSYTVTITGKGNYTGTKTVNFNINNAYFLVGTMNNWTRDQSYKLVDNGGGIEYCINNVVLFADDEFQVQSAENVWYPGGYDTNYNTPSSGTGIYDIYFRPDYSGGDDWYYNVLYAAYHDGTTSVNENVTLAPTGYGTYYNSRCEVTLPAGVVAYIVTNATPTYQEIANGDGTTKTIPAGTAVLLYSATVKAGGVAANVTLTLTPSSTTGGFTNLLHGSDIKTTTTGGATFYKLTYGSASGHESVFGWYYGEDDGAAFTSPAHKAWLALPSTNARVFLGLPGDNSTGIATIENKQQKADNVWYDLNGRRINIPMMKGIYVKEGRKVVIK